MAAVVAAVEDEAGAEKVAAYSINSSVTWSLDKLEVLSAG